MKNILLISDRESHFLSDFGRQRQKLGIPLDDSSRFPSLKRVETLDEANTLIQGNKGREKPFTHIIIERSFSDEDVLRTVRLSRQDHTRLETFVITSFVNETYEEKLREVGAKHVLMGDHAGLNRLVDSIIGVRSSAGKELEPR